MHELSKQQMGHYRHQMVILWALSLATLVLAVIAMGFGSSTNLDFLSSLKILFGLEESTELQSNILWKLRFPRILMAIVGGASLAMAGAMMQGCLGNPLVSPLTLGVASGAALGAAVAIVLGLSIVSVPELAIVANAFIFSLIVVFIIIQLANFRSVSQESYILIGIAITFIAGAIVSTMQYFATDAQLSQLAHWSFGSFSRPDLKNVLWISLAIIIFIPSGLKSAWDLNALSIGGDDFAITTGVNPAAVRMRILVVAALMTSVVIAFTGMIGFVGLAAPHMSRLVIGNDYRKLIPCAAVSGALLALFADTVGRTLFAPIIIPVGVMLSVIGGPFFMYLLLSNRGSSA